MQCAFEIQIPFWKKTPENNKSKIVSWLTSENKKLKNIFNMILSVYICDLLYITYRSNWECLNASRLTTFLFQVCNSLFLSALCPICLPKHHWDSHRMMNGSLKADQSLVACVQSSFLYPRSGRKDTRML